MVANDGSYTLGHRDWCRIFLEVSQWNTFSPEDLSELILALAIGQAQAEVKAQLATEGVPFDGARIIYSTVRMIPGPELRDYMEDW